MSPHRKISLEGHRRTALHLFSKPAITRLIMPAEIAAPFCCMQRTVKSTIWRSTAPNAARTIQRMGRSSTIIGLRPPLDVQRVP
jgi:hypothetical protein